MHLLMSAKVGGFPLILSMFDFKNVKGNKAGEGNKAGGKSGNLFDI
jgi:hypothetical protein